MKTLNNYLSFLNEKLDHTQAIVLIDNEKQKFEKTLKDPQCEKLGKKVNDLWIDASKYVNDGNKNFNPMNIDVNDKRIPEELKREMKKANKIYESCQKSFEMKRINSLIQWLKTKGVNICETKTEDVSKCKKYINDQIKWYQKNMKRV